LTKKHVDFTCTNGIAVVTIDSPPVNAFTDELHRDFLQVLGDLKDIEVRAIIITGTGAYFQAGGDMNRFLTIRSIDDAKVFVAMAQDFMNSIAAIACPTIAAINGYALGGGLEIALSCDIRIASQTASFALPEVKYGILAGAGGTQRLARLIGPGRAKLLMFTGRRIHAADAFDMGIVDGVVDPERLMPECLALAHEIAANSPIAARYIKKCVDEGLELPLPEGLDLERKYWAELIPYGDYLEGVNAWLEKRKPNFPYNKSPSNSN